MNTLHKSQPRFQFWPIKKFEIDIFGTEAQELWNESPTYIIDILDNKVYDGMKVWMKDMLCREVERYELGEYVGEWTGYTVKFKR